MGDPFQTLIETGAPRCLFVSDPDSGLRAVIVIDDVTLGPAAGGVRTLPYDDVDAAIRDAAALARAMTIKCALGGLDAGGAKAVVLDHPGLDRPRAFEVLGRRIEELGGLFRTAGDMGTTPDDVRTMAEVSQYVHDDHADLSGAVARGFMRCIEALAEAKGREVAGLRVAIQGCGSTGAAVTAALAEAGADLLVADLDTERAKRVAGANDARITSADKILAADVDVLAPCAAGGVMTPEVAERAAAWAVCGAANNVLSSDAAGWELHRRGVLLVPDVVASAGAVIAGISRTVMGVTDPAPLIDGLGETARRVLADSASRNEPTTSVARELARARIAAGRTD